MTSLAKIASLLMLAFAVLTIGQSTGQNTNPKLRKYWDHAILEQKDGMVTVRTRYPQPLVQVVEAIGEEYGWITDFEDPAYGDPDYVDVTDPAWRKLHPSEKGARTVAGDLFQTSFSPGADMSIGSPEEERVLNQVVADYAATGYPGKFTVEREINGRYSIVGVGARDANGSSKGFKPLLDMRVTLPLEERSLYDTLTLITRILSAKSGYNVEYGGMDGNWVDSTKAKIGGEERPARELLSQIASTGAYARYWRFLYDPDWKGGTFFLSFNIAMQEKAGTAWKWNPLKPKIKP